MAQVQPAAPNASVDELVTTTEYYPQTTSPTTASAGRVARTATYADGTTLVMAPRLYVYDSMGRTVLSGLDMDRDDDLDANSVDRVNGTVYSYLSSSGWWQVTEQTIYGEDAQGDPDDTAITLSEQRRRLTGFTGDVIAESTRFDIHGNATNVTTERDSTHPLITTTTDVPGADPNAVQVTYNGLTVAATDTTGATTTLQYDSLGRQTEIDGPRSGNYSRTVYGDGTSVAVDRVWKRQARDGDSGTATTEYAYTPAGRVTSITNADSETTYYDYNSRGQTTQVWGSAVQPVEMGYNSFGERTTLKTYRTGTSWSSSTWPGASETPDTTTWSFDAATGVLLTKTDAASEAVTYTYTPLGQLETRQWARDDSNTLTHYVYDPNSAELTNVNYDTDDPNVAYTYDRLGRLKTVTDVTGTRTLTYDATTLQLESEAFDTSAGTLFKDLIVTSLYEGGADPLPGRFAGVEVGITGDLDRDYLAEYGYDTAGRMDEVTGAGLPAGIDQVTYAYHPNDPNDSLLSQMAFIDPNATSLLDVDYTYESTRPLLTEISHTWLPGDQNTAVISTYGYGNDALGRRTHLGNSGVAFGSSAFTLWDYNARNELTGSRRYSGTFTSNPDESNRVSDEQFAYAYDPIGNRTDYVQFVDPNDPNDPNEPPERDWGFVTNALNQYTKVTYQQSGEEKLTRRTNYDEDGNLIERYAVGDVTNDGVADVFDINPMTDAVLAGSETAFHNDPNHPEYAGYNYWAADVNGDGDVDVFDINPFTSLIQSANASQLHSLFVYNQENRLISVVPAAPAVDAERIDFAYDYLGRRVQKAVSKYVLSDPNDPNSALTTELASDRRFVYHGWRPIVEYEALSEDPDVPQRTYTWGVDLSRAAGAAALDGAAGIGGLVAICDPNDPNDPSDTAGSWAVLSDGNGNVVQLIDCTAATVNDAIACHYEYDPYGNRFEPDPNDPNAILDATENWLRFSTKYFDAETGLGYWGYRYYDPQTGRWLTRDPIGERGGTNVYVYALNGPNVLVDAIGLKDEPTACKPCRIFLTFDDGPRWGTDDVLDVLDEVALQGKATFFIVGVHTRDTFRFRNPWRGKIAWKGTEIVKLIHDLGNFVANHSYSHANNKYSQYYDSPEGVLTDFERNRQLLEGILGDEYEGGNTGRLPGRNTWRAEDSSRTDSDSGAAADKLEDAGYTLYGWDAEYEKGAHSDAKRQSLLQRIDDMCSGKLKPSKEGNVIILLHDHNHRNSKGGRAPLKEFLEDLNRKEHYTFHRLDEY